MEYVVAAVLVVSVGTLSLGVACCGLAGVLQLMAKSSPVMQPLRNGRG
jgi:hypothetical protein